MPITVSDRHLTSALALSLALAWGCGAPAHRGEIVAAGYVEATEVRAATKIGGRLLELPIAEGERVERGQVIARFETTDQELARDTARADTDLARAQLRLAEAGFRDEDIARARAQVERAEIELAAAERDLERFSGLLESGTGTEKNRDDARTRRDAAQKALDAARQELGKLRAGLRSEEIDAARARLAASEARIAQIEQQISDATVTSPVTATVTETLVEAGEILPPGSRLAILSELDEVDLVAYVPAPDLGRLRLGQSARVTTDDGQSREGRLAYIASEAEFTPKNVQTRDERVKLVYRIKIELANTDGLFKPGMPAEAHLAPASAEGGAP